MDCLRAHPAALRSYATRRAHGAWRMAHCSKQPTAAYRSTQPAAAAHSLLQQHAAYCSTQPTAAHSLLQHAGCTYLHLKPTQPRTRTRTHTHTQAAQLAAARFADLAAAAHRAPAASRAHIVADAAAAPFEAALRALLGRSAARRAPAAACAAEPLESLLLLAPPAASSAASSAAIAAAPPRKSEPGRRPRSRSRPSLAAADAVEIDLTLDEEGEDDAFQAPRVARRALATAPAPAAPGPPTTETATVTATDATSTASAAAATATHRSTDVAVVVVADAAAGAAHEAAIEAADKAAGAAAAALCAAGGLAVGSCGSLHAAEAEGWGALRAARPLAARMSLGWVCCSVLTVQVLLPVYSTVYARYTHGACSPASLLAVVTSTCPHTLLPQIAALERRRAYPAAAALLRLLLRAPFCAGRCGRRFKVAPFLDDGIASRCRLASLTAQGAPAHPGAGSAARPSQQPGRRHAALLRGALEKVLNSGGEAYSIIVLSAIHDNAVGATGGFASASTPSTRRDGAPRHRSWRGSRAPRSPSPTCAPDPP